MSIEYTIDIQLTELGFPEILDSEEAASRTTVKGAGHRASSKPTAESPTSTEQKATTREENGMQTVDDDEWEAPQNSSEVQMNAESDSDDSAVSEVFEEEELEDEEDYEEDEEEALNDELSQTGDYRCNVCELRLPSSFKLKEHMNQHTGARPYRCAECQKRFCQISNYRAHLRKHAQAKELLRCRICLKGFRSVLDLNDHLAVNHLEKEFYECDLCKRVFASLKACQFHVQLHKSKVGFTCTTCGRRYSTSQSFAHHLKKTCCYILRCTDCTKTFTQKNALLKHSFSHLGLLPYTCVQCGCHFRLAKLYHQHKCQPQRINCVACLREFLNEVDFQQHKKDTGCWGHLEAKPDEIRCLECGQSFDTKEELKKHSGAHQRVLKCVECGKGFRSALLLMSHMGGHASKSPCLCQTCGVGFPHQQGYDSHLKTCGKTPLPTSAPKKREASKKSAPETPKVGIDPRPLETSGFSVGTNSSKTPTLNKGSNVSETSGFSVGTNNSKTPTLNKGSNVSETSGFSVSTNNSKTPTLNKGSNPSATSGFCVSTNSAKTPTLNIGSKPSETSGFSVSTNSSKKPTFNIGSNSSETSGFSISTNTSKAPKLHINAAFPEILNRSTSAQPSRTLQPSGKSSPSVLAACVDVSDPANKPVTTHAMLLKKPAQPVEDSANLGLVTEGVGSLLPEGFWKLTLDKEPPPGAKLVLFLPVCSQTNELSLPSVVSQTIPAVDTQVAPLDLSKKGTSVQSAVNNMSPVSVKRQLAELKVSGEAVCTERELNKQESKEMTPEAKTNTEVRQLTTDVRDLPNHIICSGSPALAKAVKEEPQSSGFDCHLQTSKTNQLSDCSPAKQIKLEDEISYSTYADSHVDVRYN
ncbi:zinc finger protein 354A [Thalassophryne amazonica]|uniref:zinc finger protein 354A n=1 Tax=Thalassophryne amazonica TaxID=390379 RepID=UPI0014715E26|nr:zinc finger protein 354A [Thalassophryne amazonica]